MLNFTIEKKIFFTAFIALSACFFYLNKAKPLQMDELSTFIHCNDKTWKELIESTEVGVDWMPISYFAMQWCLDQLINLSQFSMRIPNVVFLMISLVLIFKVLQKSFGSIPAVVGIFTVFTHSLHTPFILLEARPYALYLLCGAWILFALVQNNNEDSLRKFSWNLFLANFLCPSVFYIGGIYSGTALAAFIVISLIINQNMKKVVLSSLAGWALFSLICIPTLLIQAQETRTSINSSSINLQELFTLYGTQVYFPLLLIILMTVNFFIYPPKRTFLRHDSKSSPMNVGLILSISTMWLLTPLMMFILGKLTGTSFMQARYYTPNLIAMAAIVSFGVWLFIKYFDINRLSLGVYFLFSILMLSINTRSLANAYSINSVRKALSFLEEKQGIPVITLNMHVAFHVIHYHSNKTYFVVGNEEHASYMNKFSAKTNPLAILATKDSKFNFNKLIDEPRMIFISGTIPFDVSNFAKSIGFKIQRKLQLNSREAKFAYFLVE